MMWFIRMITFMMTLTLLLMFARISTAAETTPLQELHKSDIQVIKIVSSVYNEIQLFLTDHNQAVYRMSALDQNQAQQVLNRFKTNSSLFIKTVPQEHKDFYDVVEWQ